MKLMKCLFILTLLLGTFAGRKKKNEGESVQIHLPPGVHPPGTPAPGAYMPGTIAPADPGAPGDSSLWDPSQLNERDPSEWSSDWSPYDSDTDSNNDNSWSSSWTSWSPWDSSWSPWSPTDDSESDSAFWSEGLDPWSTAEEDPWSSSDMDSWSSDSTNPDEWSYYSTDDEWTFDMWSWGSDTEWNMWSSWSPWTMYELINIDNYWTEHEELNWCKDDWQPDITTESRLLDLVEDFVSSGNITNWCIAPGQVLVLTDLRNRDLNDPNGLPDIFRTEFAPIICTKKICERRLEQRNSFNAGKMINLVWRLMESFKAMGCKKCFCESEEREELETVLSITKDYLRKHVILSYNTTLETPRDVAIYFQEMKVGAELADVTPDPAKNYIPLMTMDEAVNGPGRASLDIQAHTELTHGITLFCN